jgi:hypothetical protein
MDEPIFITAFHVIFASPHSGALLRSFPSKERSEFVFAESKNGLVAVILFDGNRVTLTYANDTFLIASEKFETFVMKRDPKPEKEGLAKVTAFSFQGYRQWIVIWGAILAVAGFGFLIMLACDVCCGRRAGKRAGPQRRKED